MLQSASRYAKTKAAGEAGLKAAFPKAVILRPSVIFGPRDNFFNQICRDGANRPGLAIAGRRAYADAACLC